MPKSNFKNGVIKIVRNIPSGKVVSYGQVAIYLGIPRAARQVGWTLNRLGKDIKVPWWRVINNTGRISIKGSEYTPEDQKERLESEGVEVGKDYEIDIEKYRFLADRKFIKEMGLDESYLDQLSSKIPFIDYKNW